MNNPYTVNNPEKSGEALPLWATHVSDGQAATRCGHGPPAQGRAYSVPSAGLSGQAGPRHAWLKLALLPSCLPALDPPAPPCLAPPPSQSSCPSWQPPPAASSHPPAIDFTLPVNLIMPPGRGQHSRAQHGRAQRSTACLELVLAWRQVHCHRPVVPLAPLHLCSTGMLPGRFRFAQQGMRGRAQGVG